MTHNRLITCATLTSCGCLPHLWPSGCLRCVCRAFSHIFASQSSLLQQVFSTRNLPLAYPSAAGLPTSRLVGALLHDSARQVCKSCRQAEAPAELSRGSIGDLEAFKDFVRPKDFEAFLVPLQPQEPRLGAGTPGRCGGPALRFGPRASLLTRCARPCLPQ